MNENAYTATALPIEGYVRLPQVLQEIPVSKSSWLAGVKSGRYPSPVKLGPRTTAWRIEDIRNLIQNDGQGGGDMSEQVQNLPPSELMAKPVLFWPEFWQELLGIPESTAEEIGKSPDAPKFFLIGRRRYIRQKDALAWIDRMAEAKPYFPRRNNRKGAE